MGQRRSRAARRRGWRQTYSDAEEELDIGSDVEEEDSVHARDDTSETLRALAVNLELVLIGMREALSAGLFSVRGLINSFPPKRKEKPRGKR